MGLKGSKSSSSSSSSSSNNRRNRPSAPSKTALFQSLACADEDMAFNDFNNSNNNNNNNSSSSSSSSSTSAIETMSNMLGTPLSTSANFQQLLDDLMEPEIFLTENIFELLSEDVQVYILTFFPIADLLKVALSCRHGAELVLSDRTDGFLWKSVATSYSIEPNQYDLENLDPLNINLNNNADNTSSNPTQNNNNNNNNNTNTDNNTNNNNNNNNNNNTNGTNVSTKASSPFNKLFSKLSLNNNNNNIKKRNNLSPPSSPSSLPVTNESDSSDHTNNTNNNNNVDDVDESSSSSPTTTTTTTIMMNDNNDSNADNNSNADDDDGGGGGGGNDKDDNDHLSSTSSNKNLWRRIVRQGLCFIWEPASRAPDTNMTMSNNNRTVACERQSKWDTIRTNVPLRNGFVYVWEYTLDEHDNGGYNSYRIFVGIERSDYEFTVVGFDKIIGYNSQGVSYNVGEHSIHSANSHTLNNRSILYTEGYTFQSGDKITIKLDLKRLEKDEHACMELFKNGVWFHTVKGIQTQNITYYPALSLIGKQKVSIRRGTSMARLLYPRNYDTMTRTLTSN